MTSRAKAILLSIVAAVILLLSCTSVAWADPVIGRGRAHQDYSVSAATKNTDEFEVTGSQDSKEEWGVRSILRDNFMGIFHKKVSNGQLFPFGADEDIEKREEVNYSILTGATDKSYSLYDRFGGNITFSMYLGEMEVKTGFADKIYTALSTPLSSRNDAFGFLQDITSIGAILSQDSTEYTDQYYAGRPALKSYCDDPRVKAYEDIRASQILADSSLGMSNFFLDTSKSVTAVACFLADDSLIDTTADFLVNLFGNGSLDDILAVVRGLTPILIICLVIFVVIQGIRALFAMGKSIRELVLQFVGAIMSLVLITFILSSPATFFDLNRDIMKIPSTILAASLNTSFEEDEVVHSDSLDNVIAASLWEESVFKPWVAGVFNGHSYDELYTTYTTKSKIWELDSDAASSIGDIDVPLGCSKSAKNWAALAYSCTSIYHIDALPGEDKDMAAVGSSNGSITYEEGKYGASDTWPKASMPSSNSSIFVDDFRWIDASLKVGQYPEGSKKLATDSYVNYETYSFQGLPNSLHSVWLSLLLVPIIIFSFKKLISMLSFLVNSATLLWRSCVNVMMPAEGKYNILANLRAAMKPLVSFVFFSVMAYIAIYLYKMLAPGDIIMNMLYIALSVYLLKLTPDEMKSKINGVPAKAKSSIVKMKNLASKEKQEELRKRINDADFSSAYKKAENSKSVSEFVRGDYDGKSSEELLKSYERETASLSKPIEAKAYLTKVSRASSQSKIDPRRGRRARAILRRLERAEQLGDSNEIMRAQAEVVKLRKDGIGVASPSGKSEDELAGINRATKVTFSKQKHTKPHKGRRSNGDTAFDNKQRELDYMRANLSSGDKDKKNETIAELASRHKIRSRFATSDKSREMLSRKLLAKEARDNAKKAKWSQVEQALSSVKMSFGIGSGKPSALGLQLKVKIAIGLLIVYLAIMLFYTIVGV